MMALPTRNSLPVPACLQSHPRLAWEVCAAQTAEHAPNGRDAAAVHGRAAPRVRLHASQQPVQVAHDHLRPEVLSHVTVQREVPQSVSRPPHRVVQCPPRLLKRPQRPRDLRPRLLWHVLAQRRKRHEVQHVLSTDPWLDANLVPSPIAPSRLIRTLPSNPALFVPRPTARLARIAPPLHPTATRRSVSRNRQSIQPAHQSVSSAPALLTITITSRSLPPLAPRPSIAVLRRTLTATPGIVPNHCPGALVACGLLQLSS